MSKLEISYRNYISKAKTPLFFLVNWLMVMLILCVDTSILWDYFWGEDDFWDAMDLFSFIFWWIIIIIVFWNPPERFWDLRIYFKDNGFASINMEHLKKKHIEHPVVGVTLTLLVLIMGLNIIYVVTSILFF